MVYVPSALIERFESRKRALSTFYFKYFYSIVQAKNRAACTAEHIKCNSLTILIVTVTLSVGPSGYVNLVVILPRDKTDG